VTALGIAAARLSPGEQAGVRAVEHEIRIAVPAAAVYRLIAQVGDWPRIFSPVIHVLQEEAGDRTERIRIWSAVNGEAKSRVARRTLDSARSRISFRDEGPGQPGAVHAGTWVIEELTDFESRVRLVLEFLADDDDPRSLAPMTQAVDAGARARLADLKHGAELANEASDAVFSFADTVRISGSVKDAYDFINDAQRWPERLEHVDGAELTEDMPGVQHLATVTLMPSGSAHPTESYRVCFPYRRIAYKAITMPALMSAHTGCWAFAQDDLGVLLTSRQTVTLHAANVKSLLGPDVTFAQAREHVEHALSSNSRATLTEAKEYAERRNG
jgi:aromatase